MVVRCRFSLFAHQFPQVACFITENLTFDRLIFTESIEVACQHQRKEPCNYCDGETLRVVPKFSEAFQKRNIYDHSHSVFWILCMDSPIVWEPDHSKILQRFPRLPTSELELTTVKHELCTFDLNAVWSLSKQMPAVEIRKSDDFGCHFKSGLNRN